MRKLILLSVSLVITLVSFSQVENEKRIELELKSIDENPEISPMGKNGLIFTTYDQKSRKGFVEWQYEVYNTALESEQANTIFLKKSFFPALKVQTDSTLHTLYKEKKGAYKVVSYFLKDNLFETISGQFPKKYVVSEAYLIGDHLFFRGYIKRDLLVFCVNWKTAEQKLIPISIPGYHKQSPSIVDFNTLEEAGEVFIFLSIPSRKEKDIYVLRLTEDGERINQFKLEQTDENHLISFSATKLKEDEFILNGTYSSSVTNTSEGLFFGKLNKQKMEFINYYNFVDFENFFDYLNERKRERIEKKKKRKKDKGKELKLSYNITNHDMVVLDDGYVFLGEAYYPTYRTYTVTTTVNGTPTTTTRTVFDGYQYTHAVAVKFDKKGNKLWDVCFEMYPSFKPFSVIQFISIAEQDEQSMKMIFANRNKLESMSINYANGQIEKEKKEEEIETKEVFDKTKFTDSEITFWYDNFFLNHGIQRIKNKEKGKRSVYFISKVAY